MLGRGGLKPEPISIPAAPSIDIPGLSDLSPAQGPPELAAPMSAVSTEQQPAPPMSARQREFEQLSAALAHSEVQPEDLRVLHNLGHGSSGIVQKVLHVPSDSVLALKVIALNADEVARRSILIELRALHESRHAAIVSFYGAFYREGAVHIALEYMDGSLLDVLRAQGGPLPEPVVSAIAWPVLHGLAYLHRERHVIHRDIKPSNVLVDGAGHIKIADFGVSGELSNTLSKCASWVGTMHYMSPERISGDSYSFDSDVWPPAATRARALPREEREEGA